jgi:15-cis-phytoene synthase
MHRMIGIATAARSGAAYAAADGLLARRGHSFHWARRLLSARHAQRATRLYGFCRRIDDAADEAADAVAAHAALAAIRQALQTGECGDAGTADMLLLMGTCSIDPAVPLELLRGVEGDLGEVRVADIDELLRYCYQVAGTVGLMMAAALDVIAPEALPHAIDLGIAMQLTNICRDVRDDALMGRRYLPATLVGPLEPVALVDPAPSVRATVIHALRMLLDTADRHYASGEQGLRYLPAGASTGILVAARIYRGIGTVLRERGFDCWSSRAKVSTADKAAITLRALAATAASQSSDAARARFAPPQGVLPRHTAKTWATETGVAD